MLEKLSYTPKHAPSNDAAKAYVPGFIYADPKDPHPVHIREEFFGSRRKLRIGILGTGITAINFLHFLEESIPAASVEVLVFEKNEDVGGVWFSTRYPGCRNDMPGVGYQFSWSPNIWPEWLPSATDYGKYVQDVCRENGFDQYIRFRHEITHASWTDEDAKWTLRVQDLANDQTFEEKVDLFLDLNGPVSNPLLQIDGLENFKGRVVHTATWPENLDLTGKRVALVGCGSTGVQTAPNIINDVSKLVMWFRSKTFMLPPLIPEFAAADGNNFKYSDEQKALLKSDPDVYLSYCKAIDENLYIRWPGNINGTQGSIMAREGVLGYMQHKLASNPGLFEMLKPADFYVGCRRPTFSHGYLETLVHPKTTVLATPPSGFTATGLLDASTNTEHEIDILIAATGYDQSHLPRFPKLVNGEDMRTRWAKLASPPAYMGLCWDGMPNYFNPSSAYAAAYGSWHHVAEAMSRYIVQCITKMQVENVTVLRPKARAVEHFVRHANAFMQRQVQAGPCNAWYKTREGRPALWPGNKSHFFKVLERPRFEDFEMSFLDEEDMFSYFGNGFSEDPDAGVEGDKTWYLGKPGKEVGMEVIERLKGVYGEVIVPPPLRK